MLFLHRKSDEKDHINCQAWYSHLLRFWAILCCQLKLAVDHHILWKSVYRSRIWHIQSRMLVEHQQILFYLKFRNLLSHQAVVFDHLILQLEGPSFIPMLSQSLITIIIMYTHNSSLVWCIESSCKNHVEPPKVCVSATYHMKKNPYRLTTAQIDTLKQKQISSAATHHFIIICFISHPIIYLCLSTWMHEEIIGKMCWTHQDSGWPWHHVY